MSELLDIRGLSVHFKVGGGWRPRTLRACEDVDLKIAPGEAVALVGESGCGKSTVARAVARLVQPAAGSIGFEGVDVLKSEPRRASAGFRRKVQMIFQDPFGSLNPAHTIAHHVERPLLLHGRADRDSAPARAVELLERVGLNPGSDFAGRYPHELSGGQRQRVAIARVLAVKPTLVLADEPTSMLDLSIRAGVLELLRGLCDEEGMGLLLITHDLGAARAVADRVAVMFAGEMVETGPTEQLIANPSHPYTRRLLAAARREAITDLSKGAEAVDRTAPFVGCRFAAQCPQVFGPCAGTRPERFAVDPTHWARCHLLDNHPPSPVQAGPPEAS